MVDFAAVMRRADEIRARPCIKCHAPAGASCRALGGQRDGWKWNFDPGDEVALYHAQRYEDPRPFEKVLVTGGRDYDRPDLLWYALDCLRPRIVVQGGARGADRFAEQWVASRCAITRDYPVMTLVDGAWPAAGQKRNRRMFDAERDGLSCVVRCPGGRGTQGMEDHARANGFEPVWTWEGIVFLTPNKAGSVSV